MFTTQTTVHPDALELAEILGERPVWDRLNAHNALTARFLNDGEGAGGSGGGEGGGEGGGAGDGGEGGSGEGGSSGDAGGEGGSGDETVTLSASEHSNMQRQLREGREFRERMEREERERKRKQQEDEGQFKDLAESEKARADDLETKLQKERRTNRGNRIAQRLNFRDPGDAIALLSDAEVLDDDSKAEKALKDLAKAKPWLVVDGEKPKQKESLSGDAGGSNGADVAGTARMARAYGQGGN